MINLGHQCRENLFTLCSCSFNYAQELELKNLGNSSLNLTFYLVLFCFYVFGWFGGSSFSTNSQ